MRIRGFLNLAAVLVAVPTFAQPAGSITHAVSIPAAGDTPAHIEIVFGQIFETPEAVSAAQDRTKYRILDLYAGPGRIFAPKELTVERAVVPAMRWLPAEQMNTVQVFVQGGERAAEDNRYLLVISGLDLGKTRVRVSAAPVRITTRIGKAPAGLTQWVKAKDRDAADLFFSGSISRSAAANFYGNVDVKFRYPIERPLWNRLHSFAPSFDLAASDNPDADPDSLKLGLVWQFFPIQRRGGPLPIVRWENAFEQEGSKNFDYRTLLWRSEWLFLPAAWPVGKNGWFWLNPLVGMAAGRILEVPDGAFDTGSLFRLLAGVSATLEVPLFLAKTLTVNADYQFRQQYQDEFAGSVTLGRGSHPWTSIKAGVALNDYVTVGVTFQDGEQPPKYKAVKRNLVVDLTLKAARRTKPQ